MPILAHQVVRAIMPGPRPMKVAAGAEDEVQRQARRCGLDPEAAEYHVRRLQFCASN